MAYRGWISPRLDHGAVKGARIEVHHVFGVGWSGTCSIEQESPRWAGWIEVSRISEARTGDLAVWLELCAAFVAERD